MIRRRPSAQQLVYTILDDAELVGAVQQVDANLLGGLIKHVGLEDAGEILSLATPAQLRGLADEDLWQIDETGVDALDADRFALWLEVLNEEHPRAAAECLRSLGEDFLAHALAQLMIVLDLDRLVPVLSGVVSAEQIASSDLVDKALDASLTEEFEGLLLVSTRYNGWDAIVAAIHELDAVDHELVDRVLERVCTASMERVEDDGLHEVLTAAETVAEDARAERDDRRERRGYVSPADAAAFLRGAASRSARDIATAPEDAITAAYFRRYDPQASRPQSPGEGVARLKRLLHDSGVTPPNRPQLAASGTARSIVRRLLAELKHRDPGVHSRRAAELAYLANVFVAGCSLDGRAMGLVDSVGIALAFADAGIKAMGWEDEDELLRDRTVVSLFSIGWSLAHRLDEDSEELDTARDLRSRIRLLVRSAK
ncbi:MAG: DUF6178 family protein [Proteobacteria bacterium]|nr:DUF6178 family protein [Pseudomonadota bacterium]